MASHPHNALAWQRVSDLSQELAGLPSELSRRTLDASRRQRISRRDQLKLIAVLAVGGSLGWAAREPLGLQALLADSSTGTGEQRRVQGSDGSRIQPNTASAIDLRYSSGQRQLRLLRGELTLDSNGEDKRPFLISTRVGQLSTQDGQLLLRCADEVSALKVSGTYQLADTEQILLLARTLPLRIDYRTRYWVSIGAA